MANVFRFVDRESLKLNLNGVEFEIEVDDPVFLGKFDAFSGDMVKIGEEYENKSNHRDVVNGLGDIMNAISNGLDDLLGEGSVKSIFGSRKINFIDLAMLSEHVISEIGAFINKDLLEKYSPQRLNK